MSAETIVGSKGMSGNTIADLHEVALSWDESAQICDDLDMPELAVRDRRFAAAMREAAVMLEDQKLLVQRPIFLNSQTED